MSDLTAKFASLQAQLSTQAAEMQLLVDTVEPKLQFVLDLMDTMIVNNAANAQAILSAIGQSGACAICPTPPLLIPPTDPTTRPVNQDKCKRVQAFLHAMQEVFTVLDVASSVGIGFSPQLIIDAFNQVIADLGNTDETGLISFPEAVQLVGSLINYTASNIFVGGTLSGYFAPLVLDLRDAMYSPTTPAATQSAYNGVIAASSVPGYAQNVLIDAAYNALWSYYFDPASTPNLAGYDGFACAGAECITFTSQAVALSCGGSDGVIVWEDPFIGLTDDGAGCSAAVGVWTNTDLMPWTITPTANVRVFMGLGSFVDIAANDTYQHGSGTSHAAIVYLSGELPFDVTLCLAD